jgi:hypothetical protein
LPVLREDVPAAPISGQQTGKLSLGLGLTLLGSIIGALGGNKVGLDAKYQTAKNLSFEFSDVLMDSVEVAALDQYLAAADINPNSQHVCTLLEADEVCVVTATIKSSTITVQAAGEGGTEAKLKLPEIQQLVGAKITASASNGVTSRITYKGRIPLVFGFQAVRLFYEDGRYTAFEPLAPGAAAARGLLGVKMPAGVTPLRTEGAFVRVT